MKRMRIASSSLANMSVPIAVVSMLVVLQVNLLISVAATEKEKSKVPEVTSTVSVTSPDKLAWVNLDRTIDTIEKFENIDFVDGDEDEDDEIDYYGDTSNSVWNNEFDEEESVGFGNGNGSSSTGGVKVMSTDTELTEAPEPPDSELEKETIVTNCQCGFKRGNSGKIVGGTVAEQHAWPWMAAIVFVGDTTPRQFCGGSLINNLYILTAAHCVQDMISTGLEKFRIYLGTNAITGANSTAVPFQLSSITAHPSFNKQTLNNDVALIKLATPVVYNDTVMPICLGQKGAPHSGREATVAGWGSLSSATLTVNNLRNVKVKVLPNGSCSSNYAKIKIRITQFMMCASSPNKDSCKGDSGGPLFVRRNRNTATYDQIGVVSFGQDCGKPEYPGVYTRVGRFMKFIRENTKDATYCTLSFAKP